MYLFVASNHKKIFIHHFGTTILNIWFWLYNWNILSWKPYLSSIKNINRFCLPFWSRHSELVSFNYRFEMLKNSTHQFSFKWATNKIILGLSFYLYNILLTRQLNISTYNISIRLVKRTSFKFIWTIWPTLSHIHKPS